GKPHPVGHVEQWCVALCASAPPSARRLTRVQSGAAPHSTSLCASWESACPCRAGRSTRAGSMSRVCVRCALAHTHTSHCLADNTRGTESLYTEFQGFEIMFHVSTLLPYHDWD